MKTTTAEIQTESPMTGCIRCKYCQHLPEMKLFTSTLTNEELVSLECVKHGPAACGDTLEEAVQNWNRVAAFVGTPEYFKNISSDEYFKAGR